MKLLIVLCVIYAACAAEDEAFNNESAGNELGNENFNHHEIS